MKKKIIAMLTAMMCLASSSLCFSSVAIAANSQGDIEIAEVKASSSEAQKSLITVNDILSLAQKGDALTWSDFEKYEHTAIDDGAYKWEFTIKNDSSKLLVGGSSIEEKPEYINYVVGNGAVLDVRTEEFTSWFYDDSMSGANALISVNDILSLAEKGEALTWSDFEKYEHTDVGSGLIVWEFIIKDDSSKLLISGNSLEEKPEYINYVVSNGAVLDVRTEEFTRWFYDDSASASNAFISVNDILSLAEKGEALTWSDFEKYEHTDVGSGLIVWEFNIKDDSSKLLIGGDSLEEKPVYIRLKMSNGTTLDVRKDDLTPWYYDDSSFIMGDVNTDGAFNVSDVVLLQKWLLAVPDTHLANWKAVDFCEDNKLNVFDLCLMKRALIEKMNDEPQNVDISFKFQSVTEIRYNDDNHTKWTGFIARSENDLINIITENEGVSADKASIEGIDSNTFKDKSVVIVYSICTAGNTYSIIDNISVKGTGIDISTTSKKPMVATPDMLFRRYVYVIDKNAVTNADSFNFTDESSYYQYEEENDVITWFKKWCQAQ